MLMYMCISSLCVCVCLYARTGVFVCETVPLLKRQGSGRSHGFVKQCKGYNGCVRANVGVGFSTGDCPALVKSNPSL